MEPITHQKVNIESVHLDVDLAFDSQFNQVMQYLRKMLGQILFQLIKEPNRLVDTTNSNSGNELIKKVQTIEKQYSV